MKDLRLIGYSNADWGGDVDQCKSTSGYAFLLNDSAILWSSKNQSCVALSTMEAEYVACSAATQDAGWLRSFLQHLEIVKSTLEPMIIFCDNTAALALPRILNIIERPNISRKDITILEMQLLTWTWS